MNDLFSSMAQCGIEPKTFFSPIIDGRYHRFDVSDDRAGSKNGWYILSYTQDGQFSGSFGCWKRSIKQPFSSSKFSPISSLSESKNHSRSKSDPEQIKARRIAKQKELKRKAWNLSSIYHRLYPASENHPYLTKKRIYAHGALEYDGSLFLPMSVLTGGCVGLQKIYPNGKKEFVWGSRPRGSFFVIGLGSGGDIKQIWAVCRDKSRPVVFCEGFATGATIFERTGALVIVCWNNLNLIRVVRDISRIFAGRVVIAADNDLATFRKRGVNPGLDAAKKARDLCGAKGSKIDIVYPSVDDERVTDFNDLICHGYDLDLQF